ncbi:MAG TPA: efflux RND transporter periplasmic adaptor subunit [Candidatus Peribacteraceae bacterium]|nr:efflux RND transporter periplasmic adaptor subunit [Candidatus Peribacteraceae bacterium]
MSFVSSFLGTIKRHKWATAITIIVLIPIIGLVVFALQPSKPTYVTQKAVRGDLKQTVEAVGTVISDRDLDLQFPSSGIVSSVSVKEGDHVTAGQTIATLRSGNLAAAVASAQGQVQAAQANLDALLQGSRPEDIAITQADVDNKKASLQAAQQSLQTATDAVQSAQQNLAALKQQASTSLAGYVTTMDSSSQQQLTTADIALSSMLDIFNNNDVADAVIKYGTSEYDLLKQDIHSNDAVIKQLANTPAPVDYDTAMSLMTQTRIAVQNAATDVDRTYALISKLPVTSYFTESSRATYKSSISTQRSAIQAAVAAIDSTIKTVQDASAGYDTQITQQEAALTSAQGARDKAQADIATYQSALQISEAQLQLKTAPPRQTDIDTAEAQLQQAKGALAAAAANYQNTILTAPIDGVITKVNVKTGEVTPVGAAVTMLGTSPYRVEMYVSEIDIPKVQVSQSGSVELDAFRGTHFKLHVSEIDTAPTNQDGVNKYRVRLDFNYPHDDLKVGMTGDAEIDTGIRTNVVYVPLRSVLTNADGTKTVRVLTADGTLSQRPVTTGMEGSDGNVEIVSGVKEGDNVVVLVK